MKVNRRHLLLVLALALAWLPCSAFSAAYTNGSFEVVTPPDPSSHAVAWTEVPSGPNAILYPTNEGTTDGVRALAFNISQNPGGSVDYQTFDTLAGQTYLVTFDFGNFQANAVQLVQLEVRDGSTFNSGTELINGDGVSSGPGDASFTQNNTVIRVTDSTGTAANAPNEFTRFSFTFTAISTTSTIVLTDQAPSAVNNNSDAIIDNLQISLSAIPESSTWIMPSLVSGFLAVLFWRRRSTKTN